MVARVPIMTELLIRLVQRVLGRSRCRRRRVLAGRW